MSDVIISRVVAKHELVIGENNNELENIVDFTSDLEGVASLHFPIHKKHIVLVE